MTTYVYMLSDYGDDGAENACVTLDRTKLRDLLLRNWSRDTVLRHPRDSDQSYSSKIRAFDSYRRDAVARLDRVLEEPDEALCRMGGINLSTSWGGIQIHIMEVDKAASDIAVEPDAEFIIPLPPEPAPIVPPQTFPYSAILNEDVLTVESVHGENLLIAYNRCITVISHANDGSNTALVLVRINLVETFPAQYTAILNLDQLKNID